MLSFLKIIRKTKVDYKKAFERALFWIETYSVNNNGIAINSSQPKTIYPEVTGYFIPTLLQWGLRDKAIKFADYLVSIQNPDGSWHDPDGHSAYTFDTGQVLKGLISLVDIKPSYKNSIIKGCNWLLTQQRTNGSFSTPDYSAWSNNTEKDVHETIHLYALEPLKIAAQKWNIDKYNTAVRRALDFYLKQPDLADFNMLSHFNAYVIEALIDLGEKQRAQIAMDNIARYQQRGGAVPAHANVSFVCSTGLFQYAVCWYKLGNLEKGNTAFNYAVGLQNKTGGWFGSYGKGANYFRDEEISWAVKYFLDALYWKIRCEFNSAADDFSNMIAEDDGRYLLVEEILRKNSYKTAIDIGCGKGRFVNLLKNRNPGLKAYGVDISEKILESIPKNIETRCGSLLNIPYPDNTFDFGFCVEALEHAIYTPGAVKEMARVIKPGGELIIIDKNIKKLGRLKLSEWESWFDVNGLRKIMEDAGLKVSVRENIPYEGTSGEDGLFVGWVGKKC